MTDFIANNFLWSMRSIAYIYDTRSHRVLLSIISMQWIEHGICLTAFGMGGLEAVLPAHERDHLRFLLDWLELLRLRRFPRQMIGKLGIHTNRRFGFTVSIVLQCGDRHQQLVVYHRVAKP